MRLGGGISYGSPLRPLGLSPALPIYNPDGMAYWHAAAGRTEVGRGGVDIVWIGNSIVEGLEVSGLASYSLPNTFRRLIQARMNPAGIDGGLGFFYACTDSTIQYPNVTYGGGFAGPDAPGFTIGNRAARNTGTLNAWIQVVCDGTSLPFASDMEIVLSRANNHSDATLLLDGVNKETFSVTGIGTQSGWRAGCKQDRTGSWQHASLGSHTYRLECAEAKWLYAEGFIHYRNDFNAGVRVHRFGHSGYRADQFAGMDAIGLNGMFGAFNDSARSFYGANNPTNKRVGAFILELGLNDYTDQVSLATYKSSMRTLMQYASNLTPRPSIVLLAMHQRGDVNDTSKGIRWAQYVNALYELCDEFKDNCSLLDGYRLSKYAYSSGSGNAFMNNHSLTISGGPHLNETGSRWLGQAMLSLFAP